jgi:hypothetical protein
MIKKAKRLSDTALRQLVAQWTRVALGELVEAGDFVGKTEAMEEQRNCGMPESVDAMLALLLTHRDIAVNILEADGDIDQDFQSSNDDLLDA